jgi:hypothetical protein
VSFIFCQNNESEKKLLIHNEFRAREDEGEFHTLFGRLKGEKKTKYIGARQEHSMSTAGHV